MTLLFFAAYFLFKYFSFLALALYMIFLYIFDKLQNGDSIIEHLFKHKEKE